jgi:molecular chaperone GrpE
MADEKITQDETLEKEPETQVPETEETVPEAPEAEAPAEADPLQEAQEALKQEHDNYLRLAAEYDNFRKRSQKEKDTLFRDGKASAIEKFLPVYDNLSRALEQETADAAYKKGVEMTMTGLMEILKKLEVTIYGEPGDTFDPALHNAVMHLEDDNYKEGEIVQVFQKGFSLGGKVIRFAMVQTAN